MVGFNFQVNGWAFCNGQLLSIAEFDTLFNLIGTTYGGDGQTTFGLPNLQGRVPVHQGAGYVIGQSGGVENVTLTAAQMPAHTHAQMASTNPAAPSSTGSGSVVAASATTQFYGAAPSTPMAPTALSVMGGGQPHDNMAPFTTINFIISLFGVFPSQN
jgi:microcystin-dependent protein